MVSTPTFLLDSYKRYKAETQTFVSWIAETARECGQQINSESGNIPNKKSKSKKAQPPTVTKIPLPEFINLATAISEAEPAVKIPNRILQTLKFVIAKRQKCADWFAEQAGDESHEQDNQGHVHFIKIFEQVFDILSPKNGTTADPKKHASVEDSEKDVEFINSFAGLEVEDALSEDDASGSYRPTAPSKKKESANTTQYRYETEEEVEEMLFAIFCFYTDINDVRNYLKGLWTEYRDGKLDLMTVSMVTDTAFDLLERAEEEFAPLLPENGAGSYANSAPLMFHLLGDPTGLDFDAPYTEKFYPLADWLGLHTSKALVLNLETLATDDIFVPSMEFGTVDYTIPRETLSSYQKVEQDSTIIEEFLFFTELVDAALKTAMSPFHDKLCKGLSTAMIAYRKWEEFPPIWLVYALQTYVDIHHILKNDVGRGLEDMRMTAMRYITSLPGHMDLLSTSLEHWDADRDNKGFNDLTMFIMRWVYEDFIGDTRARMIRHRGSVRQRIEEGKKKPPRFQYFIGHPLFCGLISASITLALQKHSIALCDAWSAIMSVAHLYNASIQIGYNKEIWRDIETLIGIHDSANMFIGDLPKKPLDFYRRFGMAVAGVSAQTHAVNKTDRRGKSKGEATYSNKKRKLASTSTVSAIFLHRYAPLRPTDERLQLTLHEVESVLNKSAQRQEIETQLPSIFPTATPQQPKTAPHPGPSSQASTRLAKRFQKSHNLTQIELLEALCSTIQAEHTALQFDYLGLHDRCMRLLKEVHASLGDEPKKLFPAHIHFWSGRYTSLPHTTGWIFLTAYSTAEKLGKVDADTYEYYMRWMIQASKVVEKFAKEEGTVCLDAVDKVREQGLGENRRIYTERDIGVACYGEAGPWGDGTWVQAEVLAEEEAVSKLKVPKKKKKKSKKKSSAAAGVDVVEDAENKSVGDPE